MQSLDPLDDCNLNTKNISIRTTNYSKMRVQPSPETSFVTNILHMMNNDGNNIGVMDQLL
jgi:hypothetical protein